MSNAIYDFKVVYTHRDMDPQILEDVLNIYGTQGFFVTGVVGEKIILQRCTFSKVTNESITND